MNDPIDQSETKAAVSTGTPTIRLWPALVLVAVLWLARLFAMTGEPSPFKFFLGLIIIPFSVIASLLIWTLFASRMKWFDRLLIVGAFVVVTIATSLVSGINFPVMALIMFAAPAVATGWVGWLLVSGIFSWQIRRTGVIMIFIATGVVCSLLRLEGMTGEFASKFSWRWNPTSEQMLLSELNVSSPGTPTENTKSTDASDLVMQAGDWPGFRGPERDGRLVGVSIKTDWKASPPKELWRHRVGPGWSSFAVIGDRLFTQEQRGDDEYTVCYNAQTGTEIWTHHDGTRFYEAVAGPGPRATPTFDSGRLYAQGANGKLNCLNAATGEVIWSRDIMVDTKAKIPNWGFSSSPLVANGLVTVFAGGSDGKSIVAYQADTGALAWTSGIGTLSYCSPHRLTIDGVTQVVFSSDEGMISLEPESGKTLWEHRWLCKDIARVIQPALIGTSDLLIGTGMGVGTRRINVLREGDQWQVKELWTTRDIKPYYNDLVIQDDYLYGFDGNIFMCVGLKDGTRQWRARGYGNGQVLLLVDQKILLILSEDGHVALVAAKPDNYEEISRFKAIEGKTWNHPVVSHGKLFVRNAEEIACFRLDGEDALKEKSGEVDQTTELPMKQDDRSAESAR